MWPFSCVRPHVAVQFARVFKSTIADVTFVGALLSVNAAMNVQVFLHAESLLTIFTFEWFFSSVNSVVALETRRDCESLATDLALIRGF